MFKSMIGFRLQVFAALVLSTSALSAMPITLGDAAQFNALVLGNMSGYMSDVEGRLAVGGDLDLEHFSIGLLLDGSAGQKDNLTVGGDARIRHARVEYGNAVVGGSADVDQTVGFYRDSPEQQNGSLLTGRELELAFQALTDDLLSRSSAWGSLASTGQTLAKRNDNGELYDLRFSGGDGLNVFAVNADDLSQPDKRITFDLPSSALALVNVFGSDVDLFNTGFYHTAYSQGDQQLPDNQPEKRHDGALTNGILFNFVDASNLDLHSIGFKGSILAPLASTNFYNGHIDGNFIVASLNRTAGEFTGQINEYAFRGGPQTASAVAEPGMILLLLIGTASMMLAVTGRSYSARSIPAFATQLDQTSGLRTAERCS